MMRTDRKLFFASTPSRKKYMDVLRAKPKLPAFLDLYHRIKPMHRVYHFVTRKPLPVL